jgi:hypothetical protein
MNSPKLQEEYDEKQRRRECEREEKAYYGTMVSIVSVVH